jgi:hypothetical protein
MSEITRRHTRLGRLNLQRDCSASRSSTGTNLVLAAPKAVVLPFCQNGVTLGIMRGITVKLPETTLRRLRQEARATGRSVGALIRERLEVIPHRGSGSVHDVAADLAGSLAGGRKPATNDRRKFTRS